MASVGTTDPGRVIDHRQVDDDDPEVARIRAVLESRLFGGPEVPTRLGRFVVLDRIGAGGMGVVFSAYDPQLDRKVAIKVLFGSDSDEHERARLLAEAKAMAKLAHPNVVGVFEIGEHNGRVFVAMEYVDGRTLRQWLASGRRSWRATLAMCVQAGRGLAAAHSVGIVHRDFKPDNVLVGEDLQGTQAIERARVLDFGLARQASDDDGAARPLDAADSASGATLTRLTRTGALLGTPAYMSPEQILGKTVDAHADQFAFCIVVWEALAGERPFVGDTVRRLFEEVTRGELRSPPRATIPRWIEAVLRRGLAAERERRYPSMDALLAELERGAARRRAVELAAAVGIVALGVLATWAAVEGSQHYHAAQLVAQCEATGATIEELWNDDARARVRAGLLASGMSFGETTVEKVMPWLDGHASAWQRARIETCLDVHARGVWSEDTLDRSLWCLDERRMELEALVAELAHADTGLVQNAVIAAARLASVEACRDPGLLERLQPPPTELREQARAVRAELAHAAALERAGNYAEGLTVLQATSRQAEALGWPPLVAAAHERESRMHERQGEYAESERIGTQAYFEAARTGAWDVAAAAATLLTMVVGDDFARHGEGLAWGGHAEVALVNAGDPDGLREAWRLNAVGLVHASAGDHARAREMYERALVIQEAALGPEHPNLSVCLGNLGNAFNALGDPARARALHQRGLAIEEATLGPDHPDLADSLMSIAGDYADAGDLARAGEVYERAVGILEHALGHEHPRLAMGLHNLAHTYKARGDYARAQVLYERALAITIEAAGEGNPEVGMITLALANLHHAMGDAEGARVLHERALAILEKALGPEHTHVATGRLNLANVYFSLGEQELARENNARALAIFEKVVGPEHPKVATTLANTGKYELARGEQEAAVRTLERALRIFEYHEGSQSNEPECRFTLAQALVATHGDRARARILAEQTRDEWRTMGAGRAEALADVERWLAANDDVR